MKTLIKCVGNQGYWNSLDRGNSITTTGKIDESIFVMKEHMELTASMCAKKGFLNKFLLKSYFFSSVPPLVYFGLIRCVLLVSLFD